MADRPNVLGITIDDDSTKDIDDAVWIEEVGSEFRVLVSIADAASKVPQKSALDDRARTAIVTQYLRDSNRPMLPRRLAENAISLLPNQPRNTVTVAFSVSAHMIPKLESIYLSRLTSQGRVAYSEIGRIVGDATHAFHGMLKVASKLSFGMLAQRRSNGAMALYDLNNNWATSEDGKVRRFINKDACVGHIIIQEMMIAANTLVAQFAVENKIPILFRNHQARPSSMPREQLLLELFNEYADPKDLERLQRSVHMTMERATYGEAASGHYGLNIPYYTHFTSPIRRYADLATHRQIRGFLRNDPLPYSVEELAALAKHINEGLKENEVRVSQWMKEMAETKAASLSARRIETLNAKDFERVVKVWARSANQIPEEIKSAYLQRLKDNRVPLICTMTSLTEASADRGWADIHAATIKVLVGQPQEAASVLTLANQAHQWGQPEYETSRSGPDHAPIFLARVTMEDSNGPRTTDFVSGPSIKEARYRASVLWLADLVKQPRPSFPEEVGTPLPTARVAPPQVTQGANPVSVLQEYSQARGGGAGPQYTFKLDGPPHAPRITCVCAYLSITCQGVATKKADAKRVAAEAVVQALSKQ